MVIGQSHHVEDGRVDVFRTHRQGGAARLTRHDIRRGGIFRGDTRCWVHILAQHVVIVGGADHLVLGHWPAR